MGRIAPTGVVLEESSTWVFQTTPTAAEAAVSPPCPRREFCIPTSANELFHHAAVHVGESHVAPGVKVGEQRVVEPHQV